MILLFEISMSFMVMCVVIRSLLLSRSHFVCFTDINVTVSITCIMQINDLCDYYNYSLVDPEISQHTV